MRSPPRLCNLLKRESRTAAVGRLDQVQVTLGREAAALMPRGGSRVWDAKIGGEFSDGGPDARNVFHTHKLRNLRITVNTQIAKCLFCSRLLLCALRMEANYA